MEQLGQQVIRVARRTQALPPRVRPGDFSPRLNTRLLVLQPTPFCNIDCSYCYLPQRNSRQRMGLDTVRVAARRLREDGLLGDELTVVWHAGEPLVLPPSYFEDAFAVLTDAVGPATRVTQALQTNATLIDDAWCRFFLRHRVALGVSVDGPAWLHDRHRRNRAGAGTHASVLRGIGLLQAHGVPHHAIAVVTSATLAAAAEFFDWFEAHGLRELGCNIDEAEGAHRCSSVQGLDAPHAAFIAEGLRRHSAGRVVLRELAQAEQCLARPLPRWQWRGRDLPDNAQVVPLALVTVDAAGGFASFSPELSGQPWPAFDDFILGNVHRGGFLQALATPAFAHLWHELMLGVQACAAQCAYFDHCGGGAPANKLYEHGHLRGTETLYCRSMLQRPFEAVLRQAERRHGLAA